MKQALLILVISFISLGATAQPGGKKMQERIRAQKTAFITERLDLSVEEAQKFWPVYNAYENTIMDFRKSDFKAIRQGLMRGTLSDEDAQLALEKFMAKEDKLHEAKKQLVKDLQPIIPPQKIIKLKIAEDAFNRELLNKLKKMRERRAGKN